MSWRNFYILYTIYVLSFLNYSGIIPIYNPFVIFYMFISPFMIEYSTLLFVIMILVCLKKLYKKKNNMNIILLFLIIYLCLSEILSLIIMHAFGINISINTTYIHYYYITLIEIPVLFFLPFICLSLTRIRKI